MAPSSVMDEPPLRAPRADWDGRSTVSSTRCCSSVTDEMSGRPAAIDSTLPTSSRSDRHLDALGRRRARRLRLVVAAARNHRKRGGQHRQEVVEEP